MKWVASRHVYRYLICIDLVWNRLPFAVIPKFRLAGAMNVVVNHIGYIANVNRSQFFRQ
jgi:hypothetical protein